MFSAYFYFLQWLLCFHVGLNLVRGSAIMKDAWCWTFYWYLTLTAGYHMNVFFTLVLILKQHFFQYLPFKILNMIFYKTVFFFLNKQKWPKFPNVRCCQTQAGILMINELRHFIPAFSTWLLILVEQQQNSILKETFYKQVRLKTQSQHKRGLFLGFEDDFEWALCCNKVFFFFFL